MGHEAQDRPTSAPSAPSVVLRDGAYAKAWPYGGAQAHPQTHHSQSMPHGRTAQGCVSPCPRLRREHGQARFTHGGSRVLHRQFARLRRRRKDHREKGRDKEVHPARDARPLRILQDAHALQGACAEVPSGGRDMRSRACGICPAGWGREYGCRNGHGRPCIKMRKRCGKLQEYGK